MRHEGDGSGHGGGGYSESGSSKKQVAEEVTEVVTVLKPYWLPFCYQAPCSLLSWEMPVSLGPSLSVNHLPCDQVVREHFLQASATGGAQMSTGDWA